MSAPAATSKPLKVLHRPAPRKRSLATPQADIVFDDPPSVAGLINGYLNANTYDEDVDVTFVVPGASDPSFDDFYVLVDEAEVAGPEKFVPESEAKMIIPKGTFLQERDSVNPYLVRILVKQGSNGTVRSPVAPVMVDITPPGGDYELPPIIFTAIPAEGHLTPPKLEDMGGVLTGKISGYKGLTAGDMIQAYMDSQASGPPVEVTRDLARAKSIEVTFARALLETATPGVLTPFSYMATDPAGNRDGVGEPTSIYVDLADAPEDLEEPGVPAYDDDASDNLITEEDARTGVAVTIPSYTNAKAGDAIALAWGSQKLAPVTLTASDVAADPMITIVLDYATVQVESKDDPNPADVDVTYDVQRGGEFQATSPTHAVKVDLTLAGGPDPDPETPVNENLPKPVARGKSGKENDISVDDVAAEINVEIPYENLANPPEDVFKNGDLIDIWWGGQEVLTDREVVAGDRVSPALVVTLPPDTIKDLPGGDAVPVHYVVSRLLGDGVNRNRSTSPDQAVKVSSPADLPGEGHLDQGTYPIATPGSTPDRDLVLAYIMYFGGKDTDGKEYEALNYFAFHIPPYKNMAAGDQISVTVEGYPLAGTDHGSVPGEIVNTESYGPYTLAAGDTGKEYIVQIDNATGDYFEALPHPPGTSPKKTFGARTTYTVANASGSVTSDPLDIDYDMRKPD